MHFCGDIGGDNLLYIDSIFSHVLNSLHDERACARAVGSSMSAAQSIVAYSTRITETELTCEIRKGKTGRGPVETSIES